MRFNNQSLTTDKDETVLELLLRNNIDISYSCESGLCQSCILECHSGEIYELAQKDLKSTAITQGHFIACKQKAFKIDLWKYKFTFGNMNTSIVPAFINTYS